MDQPPDHRTPPSLEPWRSHTPHAAHIPIRPKTWYGKLIVGVVGAAVMFVAMFLSILAFAVIASILVVAVVYVWWVVRRTRRAVQRQIIDNER